LRGRCNAHGAELAFTYQGDAARQARQALAEQLGSTFVMPCDVEDIGSVDALFGEVRKALGRARLSGSRHRLPRTRRAEGPLCRHHAREFHAHDGDLVFFLHRSRKRAAKLMPKGGAMITLTFNGGDRAMPNYNVMGLAKAALEASVRYLAVDFGRSGIRVNAILGRTDPHAGGCRHRRCARNVRVPAEALAARPWRHARTKLGGAGLYLLSDLSGGVTGEIHFVDSGYNAITMPHPDALKADAAPG